MRERSSGRMLERACSMEVIVGPGRSRQSARVRAALVQQTARTEGMCVYVAGYGWSVMVGEGCEGKESWAGLSRLARCAA